MGSQHRVCISFYIQFFKNVEINSISDQISRSVVSDSWQPHDGEKVNAIQLSKNIYAKISLKKMKFFVDNEVPL